jgi:hypothetical protein
VLDDLVAYLRLVRVQGEPAPSDTSNLKPTPASSMLCERALFSAILARSVNATISGLRYNDCVG